MKKLNSFVGWTLMLAVLAVPSFLFYNWWTANAGKAAAETVTGKADINVFPGQAGSTRAVSAQPAASTSTLRSAPNQLSPAAAPAPAAAQPAPQAHASTAAVLAAAPVSPSTSAPQGAKVAVSTSSLASYYNPKVKRDPTMSPADYRRIKEAEEQAAEAERQYRASQVVKVKNSGIESRLKLQGIVGNAVILNGEMYYVGQSVYGAKILKVGSNYFIGEYKGKKFRKVLQ